MHSRVLEVSSAGSSEPHPLRALVEVAIRRVRQLALSPGQRRILHLLEYAADAIGRPILSAEDRDHLEVLLDEAATDPRLHQLEALLASETSATLERRRASGPLPLVKPDTPVLTLLLGDGIAREDQLHTRLLDTWAQAVAQIVDQLTRTLGDRASRADVIERLSDPTSVAVMLDDLACPAPLRRAVVGGLRADAALLAAVQSRIGPASAPAWLRRALAEAMVAGRQAHLGYVVAQSGVAVDLDGLGVEPLDLTALSEQYARNRAHLDAIETGASDTPFGEPILDD